MVIIHRKMWKMWSSSLKRFIQIWLTTNQRWSSNLKSSFHIWFCYTLKSKYRNLMTFFPLTSCDWNLPKSFHFLFHFCWSFANKLWHWLVNKHLCDCQDTTSLLLQRTNQKILPLHQKINKCAFSLSITLFHRLLRFLFFSCVLP